MVEMTVGSRFWYKDKLYEVVDISEKKFSCEGCIFISFPSKCKKSKCFADERHDGKSVYFKEVKWDSVAFKIRERFGVIR